MSRLTVSTMLLMFRMRYHGYSYRRSRVSCRLPSGQLSFSQDEQCPGHAHSTAYMAVAAAEMIIELTMTAQSASTRMKANVARLVRTVQMASDLRRPNLVWIIHAPT